MDLPRVAHVVRLTQRMQPRRGQSRRVRPTFRDSQADNRRIHIPCDEVVEPGRSTCELVPVLIVVIESQLAAKLQKMRAAGPGQILDYLDLLFLLMNGDSELSPNPEKPRCRCLACPRLGWNFGGS